jgi:hypothetical protein
MAAAGKDFIVETEQIKRAVELINSIEDDKFPLLLQRIALKIHSVQEASFKPDEIERLEKSLNLSNESTLMVIEILEFIFLQAAFELIKPQLLQSQLLKIKLSEEKSNAIVTLWQENAKDIIERIRQTKTISFRRLTSIKWRLSLQLASEVKTKQKLPNALFEFNLSDKSNVQVEFSKEQLYEFFSKLEIIQKQIDALSS